MSQKVGRGWLPLALGLLLGAAPGLWAQDGAAQKQTKQGPWHASGKSGAVCAGGLGAVDAGLETLKSGGNAADAAAATILALSVTDSGLFCFGGEVPIVVYD